MKTLITFACLIFGLVGTAQAQTYLGAGVTGYGSTQPRPTGAAWVATTLSAGQQIYSFTETDYTYAKGVIQSSVRSGVASYLRSFGNVKVFALADSGMATNGTSVGAAFAGGGFVYIPFGKTKAWGTAIGVRELKTTVGGTQTIIEIGVLHKQ